MHFPAERLLTQPRVRAVLLPRKMAVYGFPNLGRKIVLRLPVTELRLSVH
jgi:hypothetical protein